MGKETEGAAPEADSGDFGEGTGSLEEQLLNSIPEDGAEEDGAEAPEESSEATASDDGGTLKVADKGTPADKSAPQVTAPKQAAPLFDVNGKLSLKEGSKLTGDHIKELEKGFLRQADYTRKTQEVAKIRDEAASVIRNQEEVMKDPRNIFKYMEPSKVLSAFTKQEMMAHGLHAAGISPQVWNTFCEWFKENGDVNQGSASTVDPNAQQVSEFARRLERIEEQDKTREQKAIEARQQAEYEQTMSTYDKQVDEAIAAFPDVTKRKLLVELASGDGSESIMEIAKRMQGELEDKFQKYIAAKKEVKNKAPKSPKGGSVPIMRKQPKTWEEADAAIAGLYGDGTLKG